MEPPLVDTARAADVSGELCLHALHAAVKSISLAGAESRTHRQCLIEECISQIRLSMVDGTFLLRVTHDGYEINGTPLSVRPGTLELRRRLQRGGIRCLHICETTEDRQIRSLIQAIGCDGGGRTLIDSSSLCSRLQAARLRGIRLSGYLAPNRDRPPQLITALALDPSRSIPIWEGSWDDEIQDEEARCLAYDVGCLILDDIDATPANAPYHNRATATLERLLHELVSGRRLRPAIALLDRVSASASVSTEAKQRIEGSLHEFATVGFLRDLLRHLPPGADSSLLAFVRRLGPAVVPRLLAASGPAASGLEALLESLVRADPAPIFAALDDPDDEVRGHGLALLVEAGEALPAVVLEHLATAAAPKVRASAVRELIRQHPDRVSVERAFRVIEDDSSMVRLVGLRRLFDLAADVDFDRLQSWFDARQRAMDFAELKLALLCLAEVGQDRSLPMLRQLVEQRRLLRRRGSGQDRRACAIHAIGRIRSGAARGLLDHWSESRLPEVRDAARLVRQSNDSQPK